MVMLVLLLECVLSELPSAVGEGTGLLRRMLVMVMMMLIVIKMMTMMVMVLMLSVEISGGQGSSTKGAVSPLCAPRLKYEPRRKDLWTPRLQ